MGDLLKDRVVLVTGAGRGVGASLARRMAAEGARVVINDLGVELDGTGQDASPARLVAEEIRNLGGEAVANTGDVSDYDAAESMIAQAIDTYGRLDVLVNVAGILRDRMIYNMSEDEWDAVIRVHLKGTFNTCRHASRRWRDQENPDAHGRIINFSSGSALHGAPGQPNYAAAKMGIVGFTYSLANALGRFGVTANVISPGAATRMTASIPDGRRKGGRREDDQSRSPDNVAPATMYLASIRSDWCSGQVIRAAGYDIGLYDVPKIIRTASSDGPWDLDNAFAMMEREFKPLVDEIPARWRYKAAQPPQSAGTT